MSLILSCFDFLFYLFFQGVVVVGQVSVLSDFADGLQVADERVKVSGWGVQHVVHADVESVFVFIEKVLVERGLLEGHQLLVQLLEVRQGQVLE